MLRIDPQQSAKTTLHSLHNRNATPFEVFIALINCNGNFAEKGQNCFIFDSVVTTGDSRTLALYQQVMEDLGNPIKRESAEKELLRIAETNYPEACYEYGVLLSQKNENRQESKPLMFEFFRKAAEHASGDAKRKYSFNYAFHHIELSENLNEAERCLHDYVHALDPIALSMQSKIAIQRNPSDLTPAIALLEKGENSGNHYLLQTLGTLYIESKDLNLKSKGFKILSGLRSTPHIDFILGACYFRGIGTKKDDRLALKLLQSAALHNLPQASQLLAEFYMQGTLVNQDLNKALAWYHKALEKFLESSKQNSMEVIRQIVAIGFQIDIDKYCKDKKWIKTINQGVAFQEPLCHFVLAYAHEKKREFALAIPFYILAADLGEPRAQARLALYCQENNQNEDAHTYFEKAKNFKSQFKRFDGAVFFNLGSYCMLINAFKDAVSYFTEADKLGHPQAQKQIRIANEKLKKTVKLAPLPPPTQVEEIPLPLIPPEPVITSKELIELAKSCIEDTPHIALDHLLKSAELNDPDAYYWLGWYYEMGIGVNIDLDKAEEYYRKGALQNEPWSIDALGSLLQTQKKETPEAIFNLFLRAAKLGNEYAKNNLGICLADGYGCKQNLNMALSYFQDAAKDNLAAAHYNCGRWYEFVEKDRNTARKYYESAVELGSEKAKEALWETQNSYKRRSYFNPLRK